MNDNIENLIKEFITKNILPKVKKSKEDDITKKSISIMDSLRGSIIDANIYNETDFKKFVDDYNNNKIIIANIKEGQNEVSEFVNKDYIKLWMCLAIRTPQLNSPTACSGAGEFAFIICSPKAFKENKGDIVFNKIRYELKGKNGRVSTGVLTNDAVKLTKKLYELYNFTKEKRIGNKDWDIEVNNNVDISKRKEFVNEMSKIIGVNISNNIDKCFDKNSNLLIDCLMKEMLKETFKSQKTKDTFIIVCDDGSLFMTNKDITVDIENNNIIYTGEFFWRKDNKVSLYFNTQRNWKMYNESKHIVC